MSIANQLGEQGFRWFFGIAEDVEGDEYLLYRIKVRAFNEHDDLDTEDLPWAQVSLPTTSSTFQGASDTPAITAGTIVFGFFADGNEKQMPIILGTLPLYLNKDENLHSLSMLARGRQNLEKKLIGPEPASAYAAEYPYNRVIQSRSGHVVEIDDTPGKERIHIFHKSGSYVEVNADGRIVIKSEDDSYDITKGTKTIYSEEDINLISKRSINLEAGTGTKLKAPGGLIVTEGSIFTKGSIGSDVGATGSFSTPTGQTVHVINGLVVSIDPNE